MVERNGTRIRTLRCAIYTRKSSEEGLEQDFNSLHAQREACEAYITSQRHEGWTALPDHYDDGGFSGGSMHRPGLRQLLADISAGQVDVVVVYKVDRLTRSLTDFAKIVETFDAKGVSFVSVTQAFNTTSSMGRLTLNVLLSFAQFEREVTGERIRDKIAASKKKGLWMGGYVPMGYAADGRTLRIVEEDAAVIRMIFDRYLVLGRVTQLKDELDRKNIRTREYTSGSNTKRGGCAFSTGHLRLILKNPVYIGDVVHKGIRHKGQHRGIVSRKIFDAVQEHLAASGQERRIRPNAKNGSLLAGLLHDENDKRFTSDHAVKGGKRYRYYVAKPEGAAPVRIPAADLEPLVVEAIGGKLRDASWLIQLAPTDMPPARIQEMVHEAASLANEVEHKEARRQRDALHQLVDRVFVRQQSLSILIRLSSIVSLRGPEGAETEQGPVGTCPSIDIPTQVVRRGAEVRLVIPGQMRDEAQIDRTLVKSLARGITWYDDLISGRASSMREIAERENVDERYVFQQLRLAFLAPDLVEQCVNGSLGQLTKPGAVSRGLELPLLWAEQRGHYL